jgi:hypothetical protein
MYISRVNQDLSHHLQSKWADCISLCTSKRKAVNRKHLRLGEFYPKTTGREATSMVCATAQ